MTSAAPSVSSPDPAGSPAPAPARKLELDWLRVGVVGLVFVFHSSRFFDPDSWHVKSAVSHAWLRVPIMIFCAFAMPLLFVVSGAAVRLALANRSGGRFLRDRVLRLFVPLTIGCFTHVAYQVYLERRSHVDFQGSFLEFVPEYFRGWYGFGRGNFAWMGLHLWYLELLLVLSVVFLPLFLWLRTARGARVLDAVCGFLARPGAIYLVAFPLALALVVPPNAGPLGGRWWGGWNFPAHACFFLAGYLVAASEALYESVRRLRTVSLLLSAALAVPLITAFSSGGEPAHLSLRAWVSLGGMAVSCWLLVLGLLGTGVDLLRGRRSPALAPLNEAVMPFYVLHQSVIIAVGWEVLSLPLPDLARWAIILVVSLVLTVGAYLVLIRPFGPMRFLFGMAPPRRAPTGP
jgi:peptidoglycan/LPS O-acetylase OafA/YrhL